MSKYYEENILLLWCWGLNLVLCILANSLLPRHIPSSETKDNLNKGSMNEIAKLATETGSL